MIVCANRTTLSTMYLRRCNALHPIYSALEAAASSCCICTRKFHVGTCSALLVAGGWKKARANRAVFRHSLASTVSVFPSVHQLNSALHREPRQPKHWKRKHKRPLHPAASNTAHQLPADGVAAASPGRPSPPPTLDETPGRPEAQNPAVG